MKKLTFILFVIVSFLSCANNTKQNANKAETKVLTDLVADVYTSMSLGEYNSEALKVLQRDAKKHPELAPIDSLVSVMLANGSYYAPDLADCPIDISVSAKGPSSVNGWDASIYLKNKSGKVIKYVYFCIIGHNTVGDLIIDKYNRRMQYTGPLASDKADKDGVWTVYLENKMKRDGFEARDIEVEFMDGSKWPDNIIEDRKEVADEFMEFCIKHIVELEK